MSYKSRLLAIILIIGFDVNAFGATMNEYIITETDQPTSLDPLDADQTQNLPVARMIYATPLEIDASDAISSLVLEKFSYDKLTKTIQWKVKKGIKYANGENMTVEDVAFSVLRMTHARPKFPVLDSIEGVSEWIKESVPLKSLPKGIKISGQEITIKLTQDHPHPLFRFCLELFSIIPKKCVDLKTSKITCEKIPASGRYKIESRDQASIQFKRRIDVSGPESINFKYVPAIQIATELKNISGQSVIAGNESMYSSDDLEVFRKFDSFYYLPASRFSVLQISPEIVPFNDKLCRVIFANQFRQEYDKTTKESSPAESSIFTKIISGYLNRKDLENTVVSKLKKSEIDSCVQRLRKSEIKWGYVENEKNSGFVKAFQQTLKSLELKGQPMVFKTRKEQAEKFVLGEVSIFNSGSGFWANDPAGDLQMLFTPNLHKPLNFITKDENLQKLIKKLVDDQSDKTKYADVNKYLHDQAMFNVYTHVRRFYFSKDKNRLKQIPQGSAAPNPWQVFE